MIATIDTTDGPVVGPVGMPCQQAGWKIDAPGSLVSDPGTVIAGADSIRHGASFAAPRYFLRRPNATQSMLDLTCEAMHPSTRPILFLESFDSTTAMGETDPIWSVARKLGDLLVNLDKLAQIVEPLLEKLATSPAVEELKQMDLDEAEDDAVVFGEPHRVVRVRGQLKAIRRGEPLLVAEDFHE